MVLSLKPITYVALVVILLAGMWINGFPHASAANFPYSTYQQLLDRYVVPGKYIGGIKVNVVDYDAIQRDRVSPESLYEKILRQLLNFDPGNLQNKEEEIAFWINAYNIGAIKMIMDHYPVDSIRSTKINWLKNPWNKKILTIGNETYSLGQIEHDILIGKYGEPLIHFAIVCASLSCPDLSPQVYQGAGVMEQLERQAQQFLQNEKKGLWMRREKGEVHFSMIFKFDKKTFPNGVRDAIPLITRFIDKEEDREYLRSGDYKIKYLDYNWDLNTSSKAR
ncbi:MAG: DUF547 domain-containing protein [Deltaproteobacteria bacterium]|nr:MAG: DUF547 domain-containing protein [Deltaproteobacteria bacterium]